MSMTEDQFLGNVRALAEAVRPGLAESMDRHPSRREVDRREDAAQQAADLRMAAEATLGRAVYLLERAEPLADIMAVVAAGMAHLGEANQCEIAAGIPAATRRSVEGN
ncbi:hypothetical protein JTF08_13575 [Micrococcaceae bacterium RIT802]|nr:hypothetical protein [Micrococcaceae bacterium RIT 802]